MQGDYTIVEARHGRLHQASHGTHRQILAPRIKRANQPINNYMWFRKPTTKDFEGEGDALHCGGWWRFEIWYDLNYQYYSLKINFYL